MADSMRTSSSGTAGPVAAAAEETTSATTPAPTTSAPTTKAAPVKKAAQATQTVPSETATVKTTTVKKTAARKASASSLAVKDGEAAWTKGELKEVLDDLHQHRDRLVPLIEAHERELEGLMRDAGDGAGHDQADMGATSFERDHELTVVINEREMLLQIDRALARIDDGTYGVCESCSQPIGKMRVMAFPRATLCLTCKQREERR